MLSFNTTLGEEEGKYHSFFFKSSGNGEIFFLLHYYLQTICFRIIAVNYEARDKGVKRGMRGDEAKKLCPDIVLCKVAEVRGKADLTKYDFVHRL